jgi:DNA-directed RNA polymerase specialized sigma24 family protein
MPSEPATPREILTLVLTANYPLVCRLCAAQLGDAASGPVVAKVIMQRGLKAADRWRDDADARRWFAHHALLECRDTLARNPGRAPPTNDPLNPQPDGAGPGYLVYLQGFRRLPFQQREAIILHDLEGVDPREMALAMDCSIEAAVNHLLAGNRTLADAMGEAIEACRHNCRAAYALLTPPAAEISLAMKQVVKRRKRTVGPIVFIVLLIAAIAGALLTLWRLNR